MWVVFRECAGPGAYRALDDMAAELFPIPATGSIDEDLRLFGRLLVDWLTNDSPTVAGMVRALFSDAAHEPQIAELKRNFFASGDPLKGRKTGYGSPLAVSLFYRGVVGCSLGRVDWRDDMRSGIALERSVDVNGVVLSTLINIAYTFGILNGALLADDDALQETAEAVRIAEAGGDDVGLVQAHIARGLVLRRRATAAERAKALELLHRARDAQVRHRILSMATMADVRIVELTAETGEVQNAIENARCIVDQLFENGEMLTRGAATAALVESLLRRGSDTDMQEAAAAIERLAAVPTDPGFVLNEIPLLRMRALLARAHGDEAAYRDYRDRYRALARTLGFEAHMEWAEAMA